MNREGSGQADRPPLLEGVGLCKSFPGVDALVDVTLALHPGTVHALVGENGAGKSTLVRIFAGAQAPDAGEVRLDGRPAGHWDARAALEHGVATIYQEFNLVPHLTVAENIFLGREPGRGGVLRDRARLRGAAQALLREFDVAIDPDRRVRDLGVAQRQTVEILKALSRGNVRVLILDEPTAALSIRETETLFTTIRRLTAAGAGILYISHRLAEVEQIADDVTVMRDGRIVGWRPAARMDTGEIVRLMVGRELRDLFPSRRPPALERPTALQVEHAATDDGVRDASLSLAAGEIVGLFGLIGAGRTELVRALVGASRLTAGTATRGGRRLAPRTPFAALGAGIGLAPEDRKRDGIVGQRSVADNIALASLARGRWGRVVLRRGPLRAVCEQYRARLAIRTPSLDRPVGRLSGGNQQKVVLARLLAAEVEVLILDEPTRGIDVGAKREVYDLIVQLADGGKAVLLVTSDLEEAFGLCDRVLVMRAGAVVGEVDPRTASREEAMQLALPVRAGDGMATA